MMRKHELLQRHERRRAEGQQRLDSERAVIEVLPDDVEVARVSGGNSSGANVNGTVEIERAIADLAETLRIFPPVPLSRTVRFQGPRRTTAFYPTKRVPREWYDHAEYEVSDEIYPALLQIKPGKDADGPAIVECEWFTEPKEDFLVHMRVTIVGHGIYYKLRPHNSWACFNVPRGEYRRVHMQGEDGPPFITVWWWEGDDAGYVEDADDLTKILTGPGVEV